MSASQQQYRGIVKQVSSGDSVIIRGLKGAPPPERQLNFSNIVAPKLARRPVGNGEEAKDEPYAWKAREFLRKKLVGEEVWFTAEKPQNATREYGVVLLGKDVNSAENITESLVSEGLVSVRREARNTPELARLIELEDAAKAAGKGKWASTPAPDSVRDIKWSVDNPRNFVDKLGGKRVKAVIEHVRDGSTVRAFLVPDFYHITLMISGIRCPGYKLDSDGKPDLNTSVEFADEAKYYVELRLLQRDVEIVLESVNNNNFVGTIIHPNGNIAESLLKEGLARCVDWSMAYMKSGAAKLRAAEAQAKAKKLRLWKDYQSTSPQIHGNEKNFVGTVVEVVNGDALFVKTPNGSVKKIFLASIRPPKEPGRVADEEGKLPPRSKKIRPLYDIPWMFEAREYLRKKLIGKKVNVTVDYIQAAKDNFPEKTCCTVTISGVNVAEALVSKGLATVIRYRQDDDQRSSHYDELLAAETKAIKSQKGVHAKKDIPNHRVTDISGDSSKAKTFLPFLQRAKRTEAIVEFVASGSRLRLFIPKESCLVTFLLGGISCPRGARPGLNGQPASEGEPFGEEALLYTKEKCLQQEVEIQVESLDKVGNFIGWLWIDNVNLSVALVEMGYASVHPTAERSEYYRQLTLAEEAAKAQRLNRWKDYVEDKEEVQRIEEDKVVERKINYEKVIVTEITKEGHFYAQNVDQGAKLESLMAKIRQEFQVNPPLPGAYTPKRNDICAAKFDDDQWYRAKVEKVEKNGNVSVYYIDYGNRQTINTTRCAALPSAFTTDKPYAQEYVLACVTLPNDPDYIKESISYLSSDILDRQTLLNVEYKVGSIPAVTLTTTDTNADIGKGLIADGLLLVENRREKRLSKLVNDYKEAEKSAMKNRYHIWEYGDITEDDAREFGAGA
ncbi:staphylococcal nuclease domain-containing protein 1 isoform X1 [Chrysoperla carnea]|uniref:staphylococcal nuclease domain-containing protein 1 isoform X1 n=1 Tax=Chrysoperla carnea TaxID=189513 RepID=UPI001D07BABC|nr:staphylococcal nuclease domain-containing protein 1 isoform X1 [Chrysoperla carnea]